MHIIYNRNYTFACFKFVFINILYTSSNLLMPIYDRFSLVSFERTRDSHNDYFIKTHSSFWGLRLALLLQHLQPTAGGVRFKVAFESRQMLPDCAGIEVTWSSVTFLIFLFSQPEVFVVQTPALRGQACLHKVLSKRSEERARLWSENATFSVILIV